MNGEAERENRRSNDCHDHREEWRAKPKGPLPRLYIDQLRRHQLSQAAEALASLAHVRTLQQQRIQGDQQTKDKNDNRNPFKIDVAHLDNT
jgi:hypothetical protein